MERLPNLRLSFACDQRWDDMVGDDRARACGGCNRTVFNVSEMTRAEAEALLATTGLTPCIRFYRRPDGTVMTSDCPTGERRQKRRLAVVASSVAGTVLAVSPSARATPPPSSAEVLDETVNNAPVEVTMGVFEPPPVVTMGIPFVERPKHRTLEWSIWGRVGAGVATQHPSFLARGLALNDTETVPTFEAALAVDLTVGVANDGNLRLGAWGEVRTLSGPVAGAELVVAGMPPHPYGSSIGGAGSVVFRVGANAHVLTTELGFGYVGSEQRAPVFDWAGHVVGARVVATMNRSLDDPRDWSATVGLEIEPIGAVRAAIDVVK